jgi:hypothetical protein
VTTFATALRVATVTTDLSGQIWMDDAAQELFHSPIPSPVIPPEDWAAAFHCYDPVTRMPMDYDRLPGYRAMHEGEVTLDMLIAPPDAAERIVRTYARALRGADGEVVGVLATLTDITSDWVPCDRSPLAAITMCPCEKWQLEVPVGTPPVWIEETLLDHLSECVVMTATRMNVAASTSNI